MGIRGRQAQMQMSYGMIFSIILIIVFSVSLLIVSSTGCKKVLFIPGASLGYYVWQDKDSNVHIQWSSDRKETSFSGSVYTDGKITDLQKNGFEDDDKASLNSQSDKVDFTAKLSPQDYTDEIVLSLASYSYLEFELKLNGAYDLQRTNLGEFLNSPPSGIFKIGKDYFKDLAEIPWYQKHPWSALFYKLSTDMAFTLIFIFILGIIAIEIIRITHLRKNKKYNWYLFLCYGILILIGIGIYLFLTKLSFV
jgi:hypothetical protein